MGAGLSGGRFLLLYLGAGTHAPWLRLADNQVAARGVDFEAIPVEAADPDGSETVVGIVPGADVAIHWVDLPDLAGPQALAAARLMASEVSAERLDNLHVALSGHGENTPGHNDSGPDAKENERIMGVVGADRMTAWIAQAQAAGFDPDAMVPETLLLIPPEDGLVTTEAGDMILVRGKRQAFAVEPEMLPLLAGEAALLRVSADEIESRLADVLATWPLDLRVGIFKKRRRWRIDWPLVRRLALMGALCFALNALIQLTLIGQYEAAATRAEARTAAVARATLPRTTRITDPQAQLVARLAELRGGGVGLSTTLGGVFEALRSAPTVEVQALQFDPSGTLRVTLSGSGAADFGLVRAALDARGLVTEAGDPRASGARQVVEYRITGT